MDEAEIDQRMAGQNQRLQRISTGLKTRVIKRLLSVGITVKLDTTKISVEHQKRLQKRGPKQTLLHNNQTMH